MLSVILCALIGMIGVVFCSCAKVNWLPDILFIILNTTNCTSTFAPQALSRTPLSPFVLPRFPSLQQTPVVHTTPLILHQSVFHQSCYLGKAIHI